MTKEQSPALPSKQPPAEQLKVPSYFPLEELTRRTKYKQNGNPDFRSPDAKKPES